MGRLLEGNRPVNYVIRRALTTGLLLPALARAKQKAQAIQCINNLRQLTLGWKMYSSDNSDKLAPNGLDAWYFYGDFLYTQNECAKAVEVFQHALKIPQHPDRPLWDKNRRLVIEELLAKIQEKK